jgi:hypothetical protein
MSVKPATDITAIEGYIHKQDRKLINQMLNSLDIAKDPSVQVLRNVREPLDMNKMTVDAGARPLNTDIETAKGGRAWTRRTLTPYGAMKIIKIIPEEVRKTFMSEMLDVNAKELPFAQWVWEQEFAKLQAEVNDNFYLSEHHGNPPTFSPSATYAANALVYFNEVIYKNISGSTTTAGESPTSAAAKWQDVDNKVMLDGPNKIITTALASEGLAVAGSGGSFSETTAYDAFMDMWAVIPEAHKNKGMVAKVSFGVQQDLAINVNKLFGTGVGIGGVDTEEGKSFKLKGTGGRLIIEPATWMGASRRIIMTHKGNMVLGTNQAGDTNKVGESVKTLHGYRAIIKWMMGFQFRDLETLYVNNQA